MVRVTQINKKEACAAQNKESINFARASSLIFGSPANTPTRALNTGALFAARLGLGLGLGFVFSLFETKRAV